MKTFYSFAVTCLLACHALLAPRSAGQTGASGSTTLFSEFGIRVSFPVGWTKGVGGNSAGSDYFFYTKTFRGDNGPETIRFAAGVHKGGSTAQGIGKTNRYYFPLTTHSTELDDETAAFSTLALTGSTQGATVFAKPAGADDEGTAVVFYAFASCGRVITAVVPSEIPMTAEAELNFILQSLRCAD